MKICFVSSFPPRPDGICEFNSDLIAGLNKNTNLAYIGVAVNPSNEFITDKYDDKVKFQIRKEVLSDYVNAAKFINQTDSQLVVVQLEYALYGGYDGAYLKTLIKNVNKKLILVLHGLPINSYSRRKKVRENFFKDINPYMSGYITINPLQSRVLNKWGLKNNIVNIFHGAPDDILEYDKLQSRKRLGLDNELIIFNFGLFHKKKGLEYLLEGFKNFSQNYRKALLVLAGETLVNEKSSAYLDSLTSYIEQNHMQSQVKFVNKYLEKNEIFMYLAAADIFVLPYTKRDLVSSGPLSFATLANKFIITTPFPYARELLTKNEAYFVPYNNSEAIKKGFDFYIEKHDTDVRKMLFKLRAVGEKIKWSQISKEYISFFNSIISS